MSDSPARESSANANSSNGNNGEEKPRLSEHEKKANHIASEQKRRLAIREGFDRLADLVPGLEGQGRSESVVLKKTVDYIRVQLEERRRLVEEAESLGVMVEEGLKSTGSGSAGSRAGWSDMAG
ncbi:hypothetical protein CJF32_00005791 [Rutstroemia sp. NJR-2017a WRK4]|nr:hypothetical protein CJF32_00005791 [Rutstroemia sp. NJR-2017a WRK4]